MAIVIVTPASSTNLTTLAEVKLLLGIAVSDTSSDDKLNLLIPYASSAVQTYIGYTLGKTTITETLAGNGKQNMMLSRFPVTTLTSILLDTDTVDAADYTLQEPEAAIIFKETPWVFTGNEYRYTVQYEYGYVLPDDGSPTLPLDLQMAANLLTIAMFNNAGKDTSIEQEKFPDVYEVTYGKSRGSNIINRYFTPEIKSLLDSHTKIKL